jgi:hypothetical protein
LPLLQAAVMLFAGCVISRAQELSGAIKDFQLTAGAPSQTMQALFINGPVLFIKVMNNACRPNTS